MGDGEQPPPGEDGKQRIAASIAAAAVIPPGGGAAASWQSGAGGDLALDLACAAELRNDFGNAQRLVKRFGRDFMHVEEIGWFAWTGTHWSHEDAESRVRIAAHETALAIFDEAAAIEAQGPWQDEDAEAFAKRVAGHRSFARASGDAKRLGPMVREAAPYLAVSHRTLDADPALFNVLNGTLRLAPGAGDGGVELLAHDRGQRITKVSPVGYDPNAEYPLFRAFLDRIQPDRAVQGFLQRWFGYALTGETGEEVLALFWGEGANGKTRLVRVMLHILAEFGVTLPFASLLQDNQRRGSEASPDLARLPGKRLATASESDVGAKISESTVKQLTGNDLITARHLNKGFFEFLPTFKLVLFTNNKPKIRGQDEGIWRRIALVPFVVTIPKPERDPRLLEKLVPEAAGILNWMLDGWRMWREQGLAMPPAVTIATEQYRRESDLLGSFVADVLEQRPGAHVSARTLYEIYQRWCVANAKSPLTQTLFGTVLAERGFRKEKSGVVIYRDVAVIDDYAAHQPPPAGHGGADAGDDG